MSDLDSVTTDFQKRHKMMSKKRTKKSKGKKFAEKEMGKFAEGKLHSGSKTGPVVTDRRQAIAIMLNARKRKGYA